MDSSAAVRQELRQRRTSPPACGRASTRSYDAVVKQETDRQNWLVNNHGDENPYLLWQEMGKWMRATRITMRSVCWLSSRSSTVPVIVTPDAE